MTKDQIRRYLIDSIINNIINYMIEEENLDYVDAMKRVYESPVMEWMQDDEQDLCSQSPSYIYELIKRTESLKLQ